jgi:hypothetical protein
MIKLGTTFWGGFPGDSNGKHLWFVVSDPIRNNGVVLIANMTTRRSESEDCCVLQPGDHPSKGFGVRPLFLHMSGGTA